MPSRRIVLAAVALLLVGVLGVGGYVWLRLNTNRLHATIRGMGFLPVEPPSALRGPGAIYHIGWFGRQTALVCAVENERLKSILRDSNVPSQVLAELNSSRFGLESLLSGIQGTADTAIVQSVSFALKQPKLYEVSLADLADIITELEEKRPGCAKAIKQYLDAGDFICQGQQGLLASAHYEIKTDLAAKASVAIDKEAVDRFIKTRIDPEAKSINNSESSGENLFYGMRVTPYCISLPGKPPRPLPQTWYQWIWAWLPVTR